MKKLHIAGADLTLHDVPPNQYDLYSTLVFNGNKSNPHRFAVGDYVNITNRGISPPMPDEQPRCRVLKIYSNLTDTRVVVVLVDGKEVHNYYIGID